MKLEEVNTRTKEAVDFLVAALESGHSEVLTAYLGAMAKFHTYSFGNIMLIARQKPDATNVGGLRTWNSLGRFVKRGEKGIFILAPMVGRRSAKDTATDEPSDGTTTEGHRTLYGFRAVHVFDVSQTEGKELPTLTEVNGEVSGYRERLFKFVESQSIELTFSEQIAPAKGLSHGGKITLLSGMQPAEEFSTLVHEIAHEMLHRGERRTMTTKHVRETEAEAVAFVVCQSVGLQNGTASQDYIQLWHGDANLLRESLEAVQRTAAVILGAISSEEAGSEAGITSPSRWPSVRSTLKMSNGYEAWIGDVQRALSSINMSMDDWQSRWPFDFQAEYKAGTKADDAAMKANRFWWREQNKSLNQDCGSTPNCWLPRGHQGTCQPVSTDSRLASSYERGDYVKVEFPDETTGIGEWMWVRVTRCDEQKKLVFGILDNEPINNYEGKIALGSELAISYSQIREHRKPTEFTTQ